MDTTNTPHMYIRIDVECANADDSGPYYFSSRINIVSVARWLKAPHVEIVRIISLTETDEIE